MAEADAALKSMPVEEQKEKIGNLVADDEWMGLSMEISKSMLVDDTIVWIVFRFVWVEYSVAHHLSFLLLFYFYSGACQDGNH